MNQILFPEKIENLHFFDKKHFKMLKLQFTVIIISLISFLIYYIYSYYHLNSSSDFSNTIIDSYEIAKLYAKNNNVQTKELNINLENGESASVIGVIEIEKISIKYPILSYTSDELLKISPCKFYGTDVNKPRESLYCRT